MRCAALLLALALAACGQSAPQAPRAEATVAPTNPAAPPPMLTMSAEAFGPVRIGMTVAEASAALGRPLIVDAGLEDSVECQTFRVEGDPRENEVYYMARNGRISRVTDEGAPDARTAQGLGLGSTDAQIRAAFPNARTEPAPYDEAPAHDLVVWARPNTRGFRFEMNTQGVATALHVGDDSILYIEGCA